MKTKIIFMITALMLYASAVNAQINIAENLSKHETVSKVVISSTLLKMTSGKVFNGFDMGALAGKIERLEFFENSNDGGNSIKYIKDEMNKLSKDKSYETLMSVNEGDKKMFFYAQKGVGERFKDFIIYTIEPKGCSVVRLVGNFTLGDLQNITSNK